MQLYSTDAICCYSGLKFANGAYTEVVRANLSL